MSRKIISQIIFYSYVFFSLLIVLVASLSNELIESSWASHNLQSFSLGNTNHLAKGTIAHNSIFYNEKYFSSAIELASSVSTEKNIESIIVPHHLLASDIIARMMKRSSGREIKNVIVIGPNHDNLGVDAVTTSRSNWATPLGIIESSELIELFLEDYGELNLNDQFFKSEHSIGSELSFIKYFFPEAKLLSIIVSSYAERSDIDKLEKFLAKVASPDTLIVYSLDFSHYLELDQANINDEYTKELISNRDYEKILGLNNDYVDSPQILALSILHSSSAGTDVEIKLHDNSFSHSNGSANETTSYFGIAFFK